MLSLEDCLALCELTEDEILAIAEHEHLPEMLAAELGNYLMHQAGGEPKIRRIILDDIAAARGRGDIAHIAKLKLVLKHFIETHPRGPAAEREEETLSLKTIRLELARTADFPEGSARRGYEFKAPLTADGHIDADAFAGLRVQCNCRRCGDGVPDIEGTMHHTRHRTWAFSYAPGDDDDEPFYRLEQHVFRPGDYVTIRERDGRALPFKVVKVS